MPNVTVVNRDATFAVKQGRTVLTGAQETETRWRKYCGGQALCGTCCMIVVDGEIDPPNDIERYFIEGWGYHPNFRLACQARVNNDISVVCCGDEGFERDRVMHAVEAAEAKIKG